jgi:diguanylate cyclase (GGDEF)-like protein/PAS domain S-box-containing protein
MDKFRTVFPPLLIALPRHLEFVRDVARTLASGSRPPQQDGSCWAWYRSGADGLAEHHVDPQLRAAWDEVGTLLGTLEHDAATALTAGAEGGTAAVRQLERMLSVSARLAELIVGGSLHELGNAFDERERLLVERYEREFLEAAQIGRFSVRLSDRTFVSADEACAQMLGHAPRTLVGEDARAVLGATPFDQLVAGTAQGGTSRVLSRGVGAEAPTLELVAYREPRSRGTLRGFAVNVTAAERDAQQRKLLHAAIDCSDQVVVITDARHQIVYVNSAFTRVTGYTREEALGRNPRFLQGPETSQATRVALREAIASGQQAHAEILNYTRQGAPYWVDLSIVPVRDEGGRVTHWIAIERDVSERKAQEQEITRLAMEDHLTGLLNRRAAEARLAVEWGRARRDSNRFAIALVDVDRFKLVNDQYGHQTGDAVLCHVAATLNGNLRGGDWLARWGGEEFLMVLHGLDAGGALAAGERVRKLLKSRPVKIATGELPVTVSIGVALYGSEAASVDQLVAQADALLYEAKQAGRDRVLVAGNGAGRRGGLIWEGSQVQSALHEGRVLPVFQPIVDLRTGKVVGEEALARIRTREDALVEAKQFIQAAEALHLVRYIDRTVTAVAVERTAAAVEQGRSLGAYFINLAAQSIADTELVAALREEALAFRMLRGGDNPMVIEITERQTAGMETLKAHLAPLLDAGFRLALDDFGSGYSSFSYLAELPVDFLKIEGWMVQGLAGSARTRRLVETIVGTAKSFGVLTVAECVEDAEAAQVLCDVGVDLAQGFYFGRPASAGPCAA